MYVVSCDVMQTVAKKRVIEHKINAIDAHRKMAAKDESVGAIQKVETVVLVGFKLDGTCAHLRAVGFSLCLCQPYDCEINDCEINGVPPTDVILVH